MVESRHAWFCFVCRPKKRRGNPYWYRFDEYLGCLLCETPTDQGHEVFKKKKNLLAAGGDGEVLILQLMKDMENAELFWVASHGTVRRLKSGRHEIIHLRQPVFKTSARNIFTGNIGWLVNEKASRTGDEVTWSERPMQAESRWDTHRDSSP